MENGKSGKKDKFFDGKGFYIVLALCVLVIGVSAASIVMNNGAEPDVLDPGLTLSERTPEPVRVTPTIVNEEPIVSEIEKKDDSAVSTFSSGETYGDAPRAWVRPVVGELDRAYSVEALSYDVTMRDWRTHDGIDVLAKQGELIRAASSGTVESIKKDDLYGTTVTIDHGEGIKSVYSNLADAPTVKEGDKVNAGDVIGSVGGTALCETGQESHLHFSMSADGKSVDPDKYLPEQ